MQQKWKVRDIIEWTTRYFASKGIEEPRLEAEVLLASVFNKDRVFLYVNYDAPVNGNELDVMHDFVSRRARGEPTAYIIGRKEFMSLNFKVNSSVLIPRPDTEILVETSLTLIRNHENPRICDVGTGSGAIAVSLGFYARNSSVFATDISEGALLIARENAALNGVNVDFHHGDLLFPVKAEDEFDLITANLPYITEAEYMELDYGVSKYEPLVALLATGDGLDLYRRLIPQAMDLLKDGGHLLMEIGCNQGAKAVDMVKKISCTELIRDLSGHDRVLKIRKG